MYFFGNPEDEVVTLLDSLSSTESLGPKCPKGSWKDMTLKQQEDYFVYLRLALDKTAMDPIISEQAIEGLYLEYAELFEYLANTPSKLRKALENNTHSFFMSDNLAVVEYFKSLIKEQ